MHLSAPYPVEKTEEENQSKMNSEMNNEITAALIGVVATLLGTILGWLLNNLSNRGKLSIYTSSWKDEFEYNKTGEMVYCSKKEEVECYTFRVSFDLYNSSGNTKIMRNIMIVFNDGKNDIIQKVPDDDSTKQYSCRTNFYDKVEPINIPPKAVIKLDLHDYVWDKDGALDFIWKTKKVYLVYTDEKNKTRRMLIKAEDYENYFKNHISEEKENG